MSKAGAHQDTVLELENKPSFGILESSNDGLTLSCQDLHYSVHIGKGGKTAKPILRGISAVFRPGRVTAVMGASGAGKTTLLSLLSGDSGNAASAKQKPVLKGEICLNGEKVDLKHVSKLSGFVYQDDVILPTMTVEEAVMMSALLRLPESMPLEEKKARCCEIMQILSIEKCAKTPIGSSTQKGISGGERKRVSLAMEMIPNPPILFLDEPTSGLDTVNAYNVVALLTELAHRAGRTVIMTIHQPPSEIFHMLDDLLLLAEGRVVYHGPAADAVAYFAALGHPCPLYTNPADFFFLELLGEIRRAETEFRDGSGKLELLTATLCEKWLLSPEYKAALEHIPIASSRGLDLAHHRQEKSAFIAQFYFLLKRAGLNVIRDRMILRVKALQTIVIGVIIGLIYLGVNSKELNAQSQDRMGALYFIVLNQFMGSSMGVLNIFSKEKPVFIREHKLGYYQLPAYFVSKNLVELPYQVLFPVMLVAILYFMIGFRAEFGCFMITCLVAVLVSLNGMALGTFAASIFKSVDVALALLPMVLLPMIIFSGLVINNDSIPWYFAWIRYISPTQYGYTALMKNEFSGLVMEHNGEKVSGNAVLKQMGMNGGFSVWENIFILVGTYVVLFVASYLSLFALTRRSR
jgi:ABC-type multidrug transport system ATPase subunit/ABC-type multidrug transport system permease subunit